MAGSGIPARGAGSGAPQKLLDTSPEKQAERAAKSNFVQARMREWRKANPDAPLTMMERDRIHREALREKIPQVLDAMLEVATDNTHPDFKIVAPMLVKQDMGNPKQGVEHSGAIDSTITEIRRTIVRPRHRDAGET